VNEKAPCLNTPNQTVSFRLLHVELHIVLVVIVSVVQNLSAFDTQTLQLKQLPYLQTRNLSCSPFFIQYCPNIILNSMAAWSRINPRFGPRYIYLQQKGSRNL